MALQGDSLKLQQFVDALAEVASIVDKKGKLIAQNGQWKNFFHESAFLDNQLCNADFLESVLSKNNILTTVGTPVIVAAFNRMLRGEIEAYEAAVEIRQKLLSLKMSILKFGTEQFILLRLSEGATLFFPDNGGEIPKIVHQALLDNLSLSIAISDRSMRYIWVNMTFQKESGIKPSDIIGRSFDEIPAFNHLGKVRDLRRACYETGKKQAGILYLQRAGKELVFDLSFIPILGSDGKVEYVIALSHDITQQIRAQQSRATAYDFLNELLERMPIGFIATDHHFRVLRINKAASTLFKRSREDLIGEHIDVLIPAEFSGSDEEFHALLSKGEDPNGRVHETGDVYGVKADGTSFPIMTSLLKMSMGDFLMYCIMVVDLTEIRETEKKLLETKLSVQIMQKHEALGQLAGNVAHDFNNLMAIILGYTEMIQERNGLPNEIYSMMAEIKNAVHRGTGLTRQILAYAKHQELDINAMDLHKLLEENRAILQAALTSNVQLVMKLDAAKRFVEIDENQFMQVMLNMAVNARDAMPSGGIFTVETDDLNLDTDYFIQHGIKPQPGEYLRLTLIDTGHGMAPDILSKIFDPYFSTKPRDKGTGLGLSVIYGIIKQLNGFIFCESTPGVGTKFEVFLMLCKEECETVRLQDKGNSPIPLHEKYSEVTILVVDDEDALRGLIVAYLRKEGFIVHEATNGRHALDFIDAFSGKIDIILSDIMMPELNGIEMAEEAQLLQPEAAFIFISGYSKELLMSKGSNQNFRLLIKPFQREALLTEIHSVLKKKFS
ncbi:MAG: Sensor histidine kinase RcsC [Turneriella sp.]|nr:Sensor histidine kinase RcsC [Turneriella sp.]